MSEEYEGAEQVLDAGADTIGSDAERRQKRYLCFGMVPGACTRLKVVVAGISTGPAAGANLMLHASASSSVTLPETTIQPKHSNDRIE